MLPASKQLHRVNEEEIALLREGEADEASRRFAERSGLDREDADKYMGSLLGMIRFPCGDHYYVLRDGQAVRASDLLEWSMFFENPEDRIVKQDIIGPFHVSTVFLGIDHNFASFFSKGRPILWETMIFGPDGSSVDHYQERYASHEEAIAGHTRAVDAALRASITQNNERSLPPGE